MAIDLSLVPGRVSELLGGRAVQWVPASRQVGDYDGRQRTLEVFDAAPREQRALLRQIRSIREEIERSVGGPLVVIFHTPHETERLFPEVSLACKYRELAVRMSAWMQSPHTDQPSYDPDDIAPLTMEAA